MALSKSLWFGIVGACIVTAASCGGRTSTDASGPDKAGGTNDQAGTSSTGTTTSGTTTGGIDTGGSSSTTSGGTGTGGSIMTTGGSTTTTGSGGSVSGTGGQTGWQTGAGGCQNVGCTNIACGPGTHAVVQPGACCPTCAPCNVACPAIGCAPGSHYETMSGQCCGICVADPNTCDSGRKGYEVLRSQLLDKYGSLGCKTDIECGIATEINRCVSRCGVALPVATMESWKANILSFGEMNCSKCPPSPQPPCVATQARCIMGRCMLGPLAMPAP